MCCVVQRRAAVAPVLEDDEHVIAVAVEARDLFLTARAAVDADGVGAESRGLAGEPEYAHGVARELEEKFALTCVEIDRDEAVALFEAGGAGRDRWRDGDRVLRRCRCRDGKTEQERMGR